MGRQIAQYKQSSMGNSSGLKSAKTIMRLNSNTVHDRRNLIVSARISKRLYELNRENIVREIEKKNENVIFNEELNSRFLSASFKFYADPDLIILSMLSQKQAL